MSIAFAHILPDGPGRVLSVLLAMALILALPVPAAASQADRPKTVQLRPEITARGPMVLLGEIFVVEPDSETGRQAIAQAPAPGKRSTLDAEHLAALARTRGLAWTNPLGLRYVSITRMSRIIDQAAILEAVTAALESEAPGDRIEVDIMGHVAPIHVALDQTADLTVTLEDLDRASGRFRAAVRPAAADGADAGLRLSGRIHSLVQVPVLRQTMARGDVVRQRDWDWADLRADRLPRGAILDPVRLTGQELRRTTRAGTPLRLNDVMAPTLVEKGGIVTMIFRRPGMELTASGRALEDGALGDVIRIRNTTSLKIVEARIDGAGMALVQPMVVRTAEMRR